MTMEVDTKVAVLFSGGTDSTLTAALTTVRFKEIHMLTFDWIGLHSTANTNLNYEKLKKRFQENKFILKLIKIDKIAKYVFYENYFHCLIKYGFFVLSICGLCKLAMHIRAALYCMDNDIKHVCDGANKGMHLFPAQMLPVIKEIKKMYAELGIEYFNPVFEYDGPQNLEFTDRLHLDKLFKTVKAENTNSNIHTTGERLYELGIIPEKNVKGTELDRKMQPRCFQFILYNIFIHWYYLPAHTYDEFVQKTVEFNIEKISRITGMLIKYRENNEKSKLRGYIQ